MIEKKELINILKDALFREEKSVPVYNKHLKAAIFWAGLPDEKTARIREMMDALVRGSMRHEGLLKELISKVERSEKDAF